MKIKNLLFALFLTLGTTLLAAGNYQLSTHVLDTTTGKPGQGVKVTLERKNSDNTWVKVGEGITNQDGRINSFLKTQDKGANIGIYRFTFELEPYFGKRGQKTVFPEAVIVFKIEGDEHYHIPLVVTPYALSTYRGS